MNRLCIVVFLIISVVSVQTIAQTPDKRLLSVAYRGDIKITTDRPADFRRHREAIIIFYALPNGNTTAQTMGKKMEPGDDWHFNIQHIAAQTKFIQQEMKHKNVVVLYLENEQKSWPAWKQQHKDFAVVIPELVDSLINAMHLKRKSIYLNGHSGGGSFIFGYLAGVTTIPSAIKRISFMDSDYGYDSSYYPKLSYWLINNKHTALSVFAYNDSVALYNGKPVVSATGGTWYRSHLMLNHFSKDISFQQINTDSIIMYKSIDRRIQFFFKPNYNQGIYHTQQVDLNGFIHSVLCGTKYDSRRYRYYGSRAYGRFIE